MEKIILYGFIIVICGVATIMLAYPFLVIKQKRFTKMDLILSIIMYGTVIIFILSKLFEDGKISSVVYFSSFGLFLLLLFLSSFIDLKIFNNRNKSVIGNGLFLSNNDLFVLTNGAMPSGFNKAISEKMRNKCNNSLAQKKLGSIENPCISLKKIIEPIINSTYIIYNSSALQGSTRMIYTSDLKETTFTVADKDKWYLENSNLSDVTINKLYDYVQWCTEYVPDDFSLTLPFEKGKEIYRTLIFDSESNLPFIKFDERYPKFTNDDIDKMMKFGVSESFINAAIKLGPAIKFFYGSRISHGLSVDLSIFDGPFVHNLTSVYVSSYLLEMDKKIGPILCKYNINGLSSEKKDVNLLRTVEVYPKHGIAVIVDLKDDNKKITFKSVRNNQELLKILVNNN